MLYFCVLQSNVKALWNISFLQIQYFFLSLVEIIFGHFHSSLTKSNQTSLSTHCFNICTGKIIFCLDQINNFHLHRTIITSSFKLILDVWIWKILCFVFRSGTGNSIFLSILPGRIRAGSNVYILLVAIMTLTSA